MPPSSATTDRLRAHFARHNRRVLLLAAATALLAAAAWGLLGEAAYALTLVALSIQRPADAQAPAWFPPAFAAAALTLCLLAWLLRRLRPDERARDTKSVAEILLDFLLAIPRMTLAVPGTLGACVFLKREELRQTLALLQRIDREGALPLHALPAEIPAERTREKILLALQITGLADLHKAGPEHGGGMALRLRDDSVRALCQPMVRIRAR